MLPVLTNYDLIALWEEFENLDSISMKEREGRVRSSYSRLPKYPASDVTVDPDEGTMHFDMALAGYDKEDISVEFKDDCMLIEVQKDNAISQAKKAKAGFIKLHEGLSSQKIQVSFPVPFTKWDIKKVKAEYNNGMLSITIPQSEYAKPLRIAVK